MKKKKVYRSLTEIQLAIIDEIHEPVSELEDFMKNRINADAIFYGYQIGMSRAGMILLDKINELFPELMQD